MSVSSVADTQNVTQLFSSMFKAKGVSEEKAEKAASDIDSVLGELSAASTLSPRALIEGKLTASVQDGQLSEKDANLIRAALNEFEGSAAVEGEEGAAAGGAPAGGPPPGGAPVEDDDDDDELTVLEELLQRLEAARAEATEKGDDLRASNAADFLKEMLSDNLVDTKA